MDWASIMSAVSNGLQATNSLLSPLWQTISDNRRYRYANEAAEKENQRMIDFWNMQNEYNTPKSQMQRFVDAGLSPNLMYGYIQNSNAGDIGRPAVATREYNVDPERMTSTLSQNLSNMMDLVGKKLNLDLMNLRNRKVAAELNIGGFGTNDYNVGSYEDYVNQMARAALANRVYNTEFNDWRAIREQREAGISLYKRNFLNDTYSTRKALMNVDLDYRRFKRDLQAQISSWYEANQWFHMISSGLNTLSNFITPFIPKRSIKKIFSNTTKNVNINDDRIFYSR